MNNYDQLTNIFVNIIQIKQNKNMTNHNIIVRPAVVEDAGSITRAHYELADYCGYDMSRFNLTEDKVATTINNGKSWARYLVAEGEHSPEETALAGMIYASRMPTFAWTGKPRVYVEDLYVAEQFRGHGVGTRLLATVCRLALEYADGNPDEACVSLDTAIHNNDPTLHFYDGLGFDSHNTNLRLSGRDLKVLADTVRVEKPSGIQDS